MVSFVLRCEPNWLFDTDAHVLPCGRPEERSGKSAKGSSTSEGRQLLAEAAKKLLGMWCTLTGPRTCQCFRALLALALCVRISADVSCSGDYF